MRVDKSRLKKSGKYTNMVEHVILGMIIGCLSSIAIIGLILFIIGTMHVWGG